MGRGDWSQTVTVKTEPYIPKVGDGWYFQIKNRLRRELCLTWLSKKNKIRLDKCKRGEWEQLWTFSDNALFVNGVNGRTLIDIQPKEIEGVMTSGVHEDMELV